MSDTVPLSVLKDQPGVQGLAQLGRNALERITELERELAEAKRNYMDFDEGYAEGFSRYLERELAEAIAKERERCALVCERKIVAPAGTYQILMAAAAAIRKGE